MEYVTTFQKVEIYIGYDHFLRYMMYATNS